MTAVAPTRALAWGLHFGRQMLAHPEPLVYAVIGCAIEVHRTLGPGLLESAYESALVCELDKAGIRYRRQVSVQMTYKNTPLKSGYRADLIVEERLLLELKSIDRLHPFHTSQMVTYLKAVGLRHGLILNFNAPRLIDGLRSVVLG